MDDFNNYYAILGVNIEASAEDIRKAYIDKCFILHPDRLEGAPETAKKRAEEELKRVNEAREVLKDPHKRKAYDAKLKAHDVKLEAQKNKPKPVVDPPNIQFKDVQPGETRSASFVIRNAGGPYSRISVPNPDTWVRLVEWHSISTSDELPLQVSIEVYGPDEGKKFSEIITVKLDDEEVSLTVSLSTKKKPKHVVGKLFGKKLKPPFTLIDHDWHDIEYKYLTDWVKNRRGNLDAGEELVGKIFRYRRGNKSGIYQIQLKDDQERGAYHELRKLVPPFTLSDNEWHDINHKYLTDWVKERKDRIKAGEKLVGRYFEYQRDRLSGNYQIRLKQNQKKGTYRG